MRLKGSLRTNFNVPDEENTKSSKKAIGVSNEKKNSQVDATKTMQPPPKRNERKLDIKQTEAKSEGDNKSSFNNQEVLIKIQSMGNFLQVLTSQLLSNEIEEQQTSQLAVSSTVHWKKKQSKMTFERSFHFLYLVQVEIYKKIDWWFDTVVACLLKNRFHTLDVILFYKVLSWLC